LTADFFFLDVEEAGNVFDHLLVGKGQVAVSRTVWRGRGDNVGGVAGAVGGRGQAGWNENGGGRARHS